MFLLCNWLGVLLFPQTKTLSLKNINDKVRYCALFLKKLKMAK
ncbi:MAG: hypothetical protein ABDI07_00555 [Candidatus Kryptonium sp.]